MMYQTRPRHHAVASWQGRRGPVCPIRWREVEVEREGGQEIWGVAITGVN
jgi:hypothetical protein